MTNVPFFEEGSRLLTPTAFEFVLDGELKRALRSQNFFTLVVIETSRDGERMDVTTPDGTVMRVAEIIGKEVRDTDRIGRLEDGVLALVLIDADFEHSTRVIERLISRIQNYEFPAAVRINMGAACYPTHAVDAGSLKHQALTHPVVNWRAQARSSADQN